MDRMISDLLEGRKNTAGGGGESTDHALVMTEFEEIKTMLLTKGVNWSNLMNHEKYGSFLTRYGPFEDKMDYAYINELAGINVTE